MALAASIQITDQDIFQESSVANAELIGQLAATADGRVFRYTKNGAATLAAGKITEPVASTANYVNRAMTGYTAAQYANQVTVVLGTTATADQFVGQWLVVNDATGEGQGTYYITGNTAATAGNSNTTTLSFRGGLRQALIATSEISIIPNSGTAVVIHQAAVAIPTAGAPVMAVTANYYFWNQISGMASILSDGVIAKNAQGIPSDAVAGSVETRVDATVSNPVGYAPEATVDTEFRAFVLTLV